jgi:hypothetical protein
MRDQVLALHPAQRIPQLHELSVFMNVWPVLKSLPQMGMLLIARQLQQRGRIGDPVI